MKNLFIAIILLFTLPAFAQTDWIEEKTDYFSILHPDTWTLRPTINPDEFELKGATPDFPSTNDYLGTSLYLILQPAKYSGIDSAGIFYKKILLKEDVLKNTKIKTEKKFTFNGVEAIEFQFTGDFGKLQTACRIIIFQYKNIYYELSVTYDQRLSKKLVKEAFLVMDSFRFNR